MKTEKILVVAIVMAVCASGCSTVHKYKALREIQKTCPIAVYDSAFSYAENSGKTNDPDTIKEYVRLINTYGMLIVSAAQMSKHNGSVNEIEREAQRLQGIVR